VLSLLESDYPQDMIERLINERLQKRLFKLWWDDVEYFDALDLLRFRQRLGAAYDNLRIAMERPPVVPTKLHDR
jgi:hypothetical protein